MPPMAVSIFRNKVQDFAYISFIDFSVHISRDSLRKLCGLFTLSIEFVENITFVKGARLNEILIVIIWVYPMTR